MSEILGAGVYIGVNDVNGTPIHLGDTLEFDEKEYGCPCVFVVKLADGQIQHPGATSDLSSWCKVIKKFDS